MSPTAILYPGICLALFTVAVIARLGALRYAAVARGEVDPAYYSLYRGSDGEPERLRVLTRHTSNLFEAPTLFYAALAFASLAGVTGPVATGLAWAYFALRLLHSAIHLGGNVVRRRFYAYGASMLVLGALWVTILVGLLRA